MGKSRHASLVNQIEGFKVKDRRRSKEKKKIYIYTYEYILFLICTVHIGEQALIVTKQQKSFGKVDGRWSCS